MAALERAALPSGRGSGARALLGALALALAVLASRAPFLEPGYGLDGDGWLLAECARDIARTGEYRFSRRPGRPVQEYACALVQAGGARALNGLGALAAAASALLVTALLRSAGVRPAWPLGLASVCVPVVYVASTTSMDYVWALAGSLAALRAAQSGRALAAGALFALAVGARFTCAPLLLALAWLVARGSPAPRRAVLALLASAGVAGALVLAPVLTRYGLDLDVLLGEDVHVPSARNVLRRATLEVWGELGLMAMAVGLSLALLPARTRLAEPLGPPRRALLVALALALAGELALFAVFPIDAGYLVPASAFLLIALGLRLAPRARALVCVLLVASPFVSLAGARLAPGPVLVDHAARQAEQRTLARLLALRHEATQPALVVTGRWYPKLRYLLDGELHPRVSYVRSLRPRDLEALRAGPVQLLYVRGIEAWHRTAAHLDLRALGAHPIEVDAPDARTRSRH